MTTTIWSAGPIMSTMAAAPGEQGTFRAPPMDAKALARSTTFSLSGDGRTSSPESNAASSRLYITHVWTHTPLSNILYPQFLRRELRCEW